MTPGDFTAMLASKVAFPALSLFSPRAGEGEDPALRVYENPLGQKVLYRPASLDKMVLWEQWRWKDYRGLDIHEGDIVIDLGGHIGTSTLNYAHYVGPRGRVYSIEAMPDNFAILKRNIERNHLDNVEAFHLAIVGDPAIESIELNTNPYNTGGHSVLALSTGEGARSVTPAMTLEAFVERERIPRIDILQMDIEGAEFEIFLRTDPALIASIPQIMFEYHDGPGRDHRVLVDLLTGLGFELEEYVNFVSKALRLDTGILYARKPSSSDSRKT